METSLWELLVVYNLKKTNQIYFLIKAIFGFAIAHCSHKIVKYFDSISYSNVSDYSDKDILNELAEQYGDMGSVNETINDRFLGENVPFGLGDLLIGILAVVSAFFSTVKICQYDDANRTRCKCFKGSPAILLGFSIQFLVIRRIWNYFYNFMIFKDWHACFSGCGSLKRDYRCLPT